MAGVQPFELVSRTSEVDGALLCGVMRTASKSPTCVPGFEGTSLSFNRQSLGLNCYEVYPHVFVGDAACATDLEYLGRIGVTHILNAAEGFGPGMVNTNAAYYEAHGVIYLGLSLIDDPSFEVSPYFENAVEFVGGCIETGGKVLVHCLRGKSRSVSLVVAYLMIKVGMPAPMAVHVCSSKIPADINLGFLSELATLHNRLRALALQ